MIGLLGVWPSCVDTRDEQAIRETYVRVTVAALRTGTTCR